MVSRPTSSKSSSDPEVSYERISREDVMLTCGFPKHASESPSPTITSSSKYSSPIRRNSHDMGNSSYSGNHVIPFPPDYEKYSKKRKKKKSSNGGYGRLVRKPTCKLPPLSPSSAKTIAKFKAQQQQRLSSHTSDVSNSSKTKNLKSPLPPPPPPSAEENESNIYHRDESINYTSNMENDSTYSGSIGSYHDSRLNSTNANDNFFLTYDFLKHSGTPGGCSTGGKSFEEGVADTIKAHINKNPTTKDPPVQMYSGPRVTLSVDDSDNSSGGDSLDEDGRQQVSLGYRGRNTPVTNRPVFSLVSTGPGSAGGYRSNNPSSGSGSDAGDSSDDDHRQRSSSRYNNRNSVTICLASQKTNPTNAGNKLDSSSYSDDDYCSSNDRSGYKPLNSSSSKHSKDDKDDQLLKKQAELKSQLSLRNIEITQLRDLNDKLQSKLTTFNSAMEQNKQLQTQVNKLTKKIAQSSNLTTSHTESIASLLAILNNQLQFHRTKQQRDLQDQKQALHFITGYENKKITKLNKQIHVLKKLIMIIVINLDNVARDRADYKKFKVKPKVIEQILEREIVTERDVSLVYKHLIKYLYC